jgi:hypothetical protein
MVFEVVRQSDGTWREDILHTFGGGETDGRSPENGSLLFDAAGNLYGLPIWEPFSS